MPIRVAVIGFGLAGKVFHCPFVSAVPGLELAGILQRSGDEAHAAYPSAQIFRAFDDVCNDPTIDLIVVGTPNATHFSMARQALLAGKHVVIDKPFTATSTEARELIDIATAANKILAPFHNRRYDGDFLTLRKLLAEHTLGRVATVHSHFDRFRPQQRVNTWKEEAGPTGGMLYDLGPHVIDQALALFGPPATITANIRSDRDRTDIDDAFEVVFSYPAEEEDRPGLRYTCAATMLAADAAPRFRVHGTHGSYTKYGVDPQEPTLLAGTRPPALGSTTPWLPEQEHAWGTLTLATDPDKPAQLTHTPLPTVPGDYRQFYAGVRDAILGVAALPIPSEDGFRIMRLLELARESHQLGRTLPVSF